MVFLKLSISYLILVIFFLGCSITSEKKRANGETPTWLYNPGTSCSLDEICASSSGDSLEAADSQAKKSLAAIFETKVESIFYMSKKVFSDSEISKMSEYVEDEVQIEVEQILKGSSIKERFRKEGTFFSLATLKKQESLHILHQEISRIDDEMEHYMSLGNRLYLKKLYILYNKREALVEKGALIDSLKILRKITFSQISNLKFNSVGASRVALSSLDGVPSVLLKKIEETFTDLGYKITKKNDKEYLISISFKEKNEYLNVEGFKKFTYEVTLESSSHLGEKLGGFIIYETSQGRNKKDAFLRVREKIVQLIANKITKLNLK